MVDTFCSIGDSHASLFCGERRILPIQTWFRNNQYNCFVVGPVLAYTIINRRDEIVNLIRGSGCNNVIYNFGEIDCRAQVRKRSTDTMSVEGVLDDIIKNYTNFLLYMKNSNLVTRTFVCGVLPCYLEKPFESYYRRFYDEFDTPRGTLEERNYYKRYFNNRIEKFCNENGLYFISVFDSLLEHIKNGEHEKYYIDDIHGMPGVISTELEEQILNIINYGSNNSTLLPIPQDIPDKALLIADKPENVSLKSPTVYFYWATANNVFERRDEIVKVIKKHKTVIFCFGAEDCKLIESLNSQDFKIEMNDVLNNYSFFMNYIKHNTDIKNVIIRGVKNTSAIAQYFNENCSVLCNDYKIYYMPDYIFELKDNGI